MINLPICIQYINLLFVQISFIHVETKEFVVRMFVEFILSALDLDRPQRNFASLFTTAQCIIFPVDMSLKKIQADEQCVCPASNDNEAAPICW